MTAKEKKTGKTEKTGKKEKKEKAAAGAAKKAPAKKTGRAKAETPKPAAKATAKKKAPAAKKSTGAGTQEILAEVQSLKQMVGKLLPSEGGPNADVDASADALRRLLSDLLERRLESVIKELAEVRGAVPVLKFPNAEPVARRLDTLLGDLGAIRYDAEQMDYMDPLIHNVVGERSVKDAPDGVILETVSPGYRTVRGLIVTKAAVVVNRSA